MTRLIERSSTIPKDEASKQIDTKDGLENYCDAQRHWVGGSVCAKIATLPVPNSITNPQCKSALQLSKDSFFLDVTMCGTVQADSLTGKGSSQVRDFCCFLLVLDVTALDHGL